MLIENYKNCSKELSDLLIKNGKDAVAQFFIDIESKICSGQPHEKWGAVQELMKSGKITDLAAFTEEEEEAYDRLYAVAQSLQQSNKS